MTNGGVLQIHIELENPARHGARRRVDDVAIGTASMFSWLPSTELDAIGIARERSMRFRRSDGQTIERWVGTAFVHLGGRSTIDMVVFGESGDAVVLGWRTLSGLNLKIDPVTKRLVDAGPMPAAAA